MAKLFRGIEPPDTFDHMVGYLVDTPDGSVGVLDGWNRDDDGRPETVVVVQGWFGRRLFEIPVAKLAGIDHDQKRVTLARGAAPVEPGGIFQRFFEHVRPSSKPDDAPSQPKRHTGNRPVLCAVADDAQAAHVVAIAEQLAIALAAPLLITHVTRSDVPPGVSAVADGQARLRDSEQRDAEDLVEGLLAGVSPGASASRIIARGSASKTLEELANAEDASFLVIGTAGRGLLSATLNGSVSHHLAAHAPCPVVVVPPGIQLERTALHG